MISPNRKNTVNMTGHHQYESKGFFLRDPFVVKFQSNKTGQWTLTSFQHHNDQQNWLLHLFVFLLCLIPQQSRILFWFPCTVTPTMLSRSSTNSMMSMWKSPISGRTRWGNRLWLIEKERRRSRYSYEASLSLSSSLWIRRCNPDCKSKQQQLNVDTVRLCVWVECDVSGRFPRRLRLLEPIWQEEHQTVHQQDVHLAGQRQSGHHGQQPDELCLRQVHAAVGEEILCVTAYVLSLWVFEQQVSSFICTLSVLRIVVSGKPFLKAIKPLSAQPFKLDSKIPKAMVLLPDWGFFNDLRFRFFQSHQYKMCMPFVMQLLCFVLTTILSRTTASWLNFKS